MPVIRTATEKDLTDIIRLYEQLLLDPNGLERVQRTSMDNYKKALGDISALPGCEVIVAEEQGRVIGTAMMMIVPNLTHGALPWAIVENVVVENDLRGTGVGKLLMEYIREKAVNAGCYKIQLMSDKRRSEAHKFYRTIGYNATAEGFRIYL